MNNTQKIHFGCIDNHDYWLYIIENDYLKAEITNFGATLVSLIEKSTMHNCVLNNENVNQYLENINEALGATIGRNANRIKDGKFKINNQEYKCFINNGPNSLHGGKDGFMKKEFIVKQHTSDSIVLSYHSYHLEEGFPGNLDLKITYRLEENNLIYEIEGISDQDTIFNITNHSYFNLGDCNILNHYLQIPTQQFSLVDEHGLTLATADNVNSSFDFRKLTKINDNFQLQHPNLLLAKGLDHNYVFETSDNDLRAILSYKHLKLTVYSDLPDMHVYTGNYLRKKHQGIALECQYYPNSINYTDFKKPILLANSLVKHYIKYTIERN